MQFQLQNIDYFFQCFSTVFLCFSLLFSQLILIVFTAYDLQLPKLKKFIKDKYVNKKWFRDAKKQKKKEKAESSSEDDESSDDSNENTKVQVKSPLDFRVF